ncbi:MAG: hypothetical protein RLZZ297_1567 [Chloroflexota bacterium]
MTPSSITFVTASAPHHPGPAARVLPIARYAARHGWSVTILCLDPAWKKNGPQTQTVDGVTIATVGQMHVGADGQPASGVRLLAIAIAAVWCLARAALATRPAALVICKALPLNGIAAQLAARWCRCPLVLDADDAEAASHASAAAWVVAGLAWYERELPRWVASTTTATRWQTRSAGYQRAVAVPNGVDLELFSPSDSATALAYARAHGIPTPALVYVGSLRLTSHAVDLLLQAYARSSRLLPLVIAGSGPDEAALHRLAAELGIAEHIVWLGQIDCSAVPLLLASAQASCDPVRADAAAAARFPLKIVESLALGVPVITSPIGDRATHWPIGLILATAGDADAYAAALDRAMTQPPDRAAICALGVTASWEQLAPRWYAAHGIALGAPDATR